VIFSFWRERHDLTGQLREGLFCAELFQALSAILCFARKTPKSNLPYLPLDEPAHRLAVVRYIHATASCNRIKGFLSLYRHIAANPSGA
jgi:hypothetical protein